MTDQKNRPTRLHLITTPKRPDVFMGANAAVVAEGPRSDEKEAVSYWDRPRRAVAPSVS